ncbi:hypothetical protein GIW30_06175 [Pseudomonas sp. PA-5-4G]|nr:hypothetical protein [Pseudomonas sp. PA-5-4H]MCF5235103.1 hypothetical protein [Pseudomonas sp. PA-5-4G]MCF5246648.1 hypothetical protein [Pseudomonas sp. PA-5-4B]MCF5253338.1 hypothetical protein [Pseudomonas sp. PA-5-4B]MCF5260061.1 hypothetical protein [Pseudomonas sp. PA-5-4A]
MVPVAGSNPGLVNVLLEQFDGAQVEFAAGARYLTQTLVEQDRGREDLGTGCPSPRKFASPLRRGQAPGVRNG